ncbi:Ankyrin repeat-containing protein [Vanrija pseudolonga]|uniref:Ankyrin repeat-containing protein n=1 Tax=Vanrija pseudolonga TaxID=143232 RepID=A0AAF0Y016_9TREE|nr:Ankyrin repeat-containing protein [Vanrija pseudolonga]
MAPTTEELDDVLLSCRYGEVEEVQEFATKHGWEALTAAKDERGNTILHMTSGNGHLDVLKVLLPHVPAALLQEVNEAGSPAIHWAVLNNHVAIVQALVEVPEENGGGIQLLKQKNAAGRDAFSEAIFAGEGKEEVAGWIEGYLWKIEGGDEEEEGAAAAGAEGEEEAAAADADETELVVKAEELKVAEQA